MYISKHAISGDKTIHFCNETNKLATQLKAIKQIDSNNFFISRLFRKSSLLIPETEVADYAFKIDGKTYNDEEICEMVCNRFSASMIKGALEYKNLQLKKICKTNLKLSQVDISFLQVMSNKLDIALEDNHNSMATQVSTSILNSVLDATIYLSSRDDFSVTVGFCKTGVAFESSCIFTTKEILKLQEIMNSRELF